MEKYKPLNDLVLIDPDDVKPYNEYKGLTKIIVPDEFEHGPEDRPIWGTVVSLGPTCQGDFKRGDKVLMGKWAGAWVKLAREKKYIIVREYDILAKEVR